MVENIEAEDVCKVIARKKKKRRGKAEQLLRVCVCVFSLCWLQDCHSTLVE